MIVLITDNFKEEGNSITTPYNWIYEYDLGNRQKRFKLSGLKIPLRQGDYIVYVDSSETWDKIKDNRSDVVIEVVRKSPMNKDPVDLKAQRASHFPSKLRLSDYKRILS